MTAHRLDVPEAERLSICPLWVVQGTSIRAHLFGTKIDLFFDSAHQSGGASLPWAAISRPLSGWLTRRPQRMVGKPGELG
jgi:hypothetical protein